MSPTVAHLGKPVPGTDQLVVLAYDSGLLIHGDNDHAATYD